MYIVYESEFDTDKPREYMAEPKILLVTMDEQKAVKKIYERYNWYSKNCSEYYDLDKLEDGFSFTDNSTTYGKVGIIKQEVL